MSALWGVSGLCAARQGDNFGNLKAPLFKVPAPPKKPVPEEQVSLPAPVTKKAPPPRGRVCPTPPTGPSSLESLPFPLCVLLVPALRLSVRPLIEFPCVYACDVFRTCAPIFPVKVLYCANLPRTLERIVKSLDFSTSTLMLS